MPTYEYECVKCGNTFEYFQSVNEEPKTKCEICGGRLIKLVSPGAGLIFKGHGFYITDYKKRTASDSTVDGKKDAAETKTSPSKETKKDAPST